MWFPYVGLFSSQGNRVNVDSTEDAGFGSIQK
jgi:hypothetical protein